MGYRQKDPYVGRINMWKYTKLGKSEGHNKMNFKN